MKPYVSEILERKGKVCKLPLPSKYRELLDCIQALELKVNKDEEDMRLVGYESLFEPKPSAGLARWLVNMTAEKLSSLTFEQVEAVGKVCVAFGLDFSQITDVVDYMRTKKGETIYEVYELK